MQSPIRPVFSPTLTLVGLEDVKGASSLVEEAEVGTPTGAGVEMREWKYSELEKVYQLHESLNGSTDPIPKPHFGTLLHTPHSHILLAFPNPSVANINTNPLVLSDTLFPSTHLPLPLQQTLNSSIPTQTQASDPLAYLIYTLVASAPNTLSSVPAPPTLVFQTIGVLLEHRARGVAKGLVERALEEARVYGRESGGEGRVRVKVWMKVGREEEEGGWKGLAEGLGLEREGRGGWWGGLV